MCGSCNPGVSLFNHSITQKLDFVEHRRRHGTQADLPPTSTKATLFKNGSILTMADGELSPVESLVIRDNIIIFVGNFHDAQQIAGRDAQIVDLQGSSILPGFIDPHIHLTSTSMVKRFYIDMMPTKVDSLDKALSILREAATQGPNMGGWIVAFGYDPSRIEPDHPSLTIRQLNSISSTIPIMVINASGHIAYCNQAAFNKNNITAENASTDFVIDSNTGQLTGEINETAVTLMASQIEAPPVQDILDACQNTMLAWAAKGCTTVFDAGIGTGGDADIALLEAITAKPTPVQVTGALVSTIVPFHTIPLLQSPPYRIGTVLVNSVKFWADGSTQGFTAAVKQPYLNPPAIQPCGKLNYPKTENLLSQIEPWFKKGFSIVIHANGDAAIDQGLDVYELVMRANPGVKHIGMHRLDHFTMASDQQILRAASLGLGVSHTMGHVNSWGETFLSYVLGKERASRIHPLQTDLSARLNFSLHSDSPTVDVFPLQTVRTAMLRKMDANGQALGSSQCIDLLSALKAVTINPAKQIGIDSKTGSLEVGKMADFVVLDKDIREVAPQKLETLVVKQTWSEGRVTFDARLKKTGYA